MTDSILVHGTAVAIDGAAILLRGASGAGKSDLALRLIDCGACLVADDQAELRRAEDHILVSAPAVIAGLIEIRGLGILHIDAVTAAPLALLVDLVSPTEVERLPESCTEDVLGLSVQVIALAPFEASAPAKVRLARRAFPARQVRTILS